MSNRVPISKTVRFEIFKRDEFTCQYCGRKPPAVVLEIDHIVAVTEGGSNDEHNLITACFDCNRGKGARSLGMTSPVDVKQRADLLREREEQVREYEKLLQERREREDESINHVIGVYEEIYSGWTLNINARPSIRRFLRELPMTEVIEAMEIACRRFRAEIELDPETNKVVQRPNRRVFKYFCGVCWRKIKEDKNGAC